MNFKYQSEIKQNISSIEYKNSIKDYYEEEKLTKLFIQNEVHFYTTETKINYSF